MIRSNTMISSGSLEQMIFLFRIQIGSKKTKKVLNNIKKWAEDVIENPENYSAKMKSDEKIREFKGIIEQINEHINEMKDNPELITADKPSSFPFYLSVGIIILLTI